MSLENDQRMETLLAEQEARDVADFVVGAVVYRAHDGEIREGRVTSVDRCNREEDGPSRFGKLPLYIASFDRPNRKPDFVQQTGAWKFHVHRQDALLDLQEAIEDAIAAETRTIRDAQARIVQKQARLDALKAEIASGPVPVALRL